jgi:biotin carboxyl carrier protein
MTRARYFVGEVESKESPTAVEIESIAEGQFAISLQGKRYEIDAQLLEGDNLSLLLDGISYWVELESSPERTLARVRRQTFALEVRDERRHRLRQAAPVVTLEGRQTVRSPMPGKVVKLLVRAGDSVKSGQGLVVVEAMKMENELKSPKDGKVVEILVAEGAAVESQAPLLAVE